MVDGTLQFSTGIDNSGFTSGINDLAIIADNAIANIASSIVTTISAAVAEIPAQMVEIGSAFESSMSQVAATMGITSASEEFEALSEAAKEMGETTKFSASQAGEALNYLALAGYDAEKAIDALPTVLNVAAAGGMELADASDMITDAMSALGLETSEMTTFADQLAVTSQKSNTSVSQLGEAILTVGGTAKTLEGGVTEMNTALGLLADNGIKGAEGGTALRNVILSLSAPTSTASAELKKLGVSAFDLATGEMRPLEDTFADLNDALSELTSQEQTEALNNIFNKTDLKSVNALLGTSAERWEELTGYIDDCEGAAEQMAETMDDNLTGDLTIMNSALEGLGIAAYEKFQQPLRTAVQAVTEDLGTLTSSLTDGDLSDSFDTIAESFSNLASTALNFVSNNVIPTVISGLETIIDNADTIKTTISLIAAEFVAMKAAAVLTPIVTGITEANKALTLLAAETSVATFQQAALAGGMSATEVVVGLFTGKITLATAAQAAFKLMTESTTVAVIASTAALAALAAVTIGAALAFKNYVDNMETAAETDPWLEQAQKDTAAIKEEQQAIEDLISVQEDKNSSDEAEINNIQKLWTELQNYVDENGNVISSNERASEIIGTLNSAYGLNIDYIDGQIQGYGELATSMDDYIAQLRLESKIRNGQDAYDEAIQKQEEYSKKREELEEQLNTKIAAFQATDDNDVKGVFAVQIGSLREQIAALDESSAMYQDTIDNYEGLFATSSNNTASAAQMSIEESASSFRDTMLSASETMTLSAEEATAALKEGFAQAEHDYKTGAIASDEELIAEKQRLWDEYGDESNSDHWKYYEDLLDAQSDYNEQAQKAAEDAAEEQYNAPLDALKEGWTKAEHEYAIGLLTDEEYLAEKQRLWDEYGDESRSDMYSYYEDLLDLQEDYNDRSTQAAEDEWNKIEQQNNLGLLSDEETYQKKLEWIKKYCPEYSDEWYSYYKDVYDYQQEYAKKQLDEYKDNLKEQVSTLKSSLSEIVSEYKEKYKEIQSNIDSFKSKLLSLGDAFSVIENEDGSKTLKVNDLQEQMQQMKEYTAYIKKLKEQGASQAMLEELTSMDTEDGLAFAKNLANMSSEDFAQVNDYYNQREKLAEELATDLYSSDTDDLNRQLVDDVVEKFGMLPEEIQAIGEKTVASFIAGLTSGDLSDKTSDFVDSLVSTLNTGIDNIELTNTTIDLTASLDDLADTDTYSIGKSLGDDFADGFEDALADLKSKLGDLQATVSAEQSSVSAEYTAGSSASQGTSGTQSTAGGDKVVVENKTTVKLELDGEKLAEKVIEKTDTINRRKGK